MANTALHSVWEHPDLKKALKIVLKFEIQSLLQRLAATGEESVVITASSADGTASHLGSHKGEAFVQGPEFEDMKRKFYTYCNGDGSAVQKETVLPEIQSRTIQSRSNSNVSHNSPDQPTPTGSVDDFVIKTESGEAMETGSSQNRLDQGLTNKEQESDEQNPEMRRVSQSEEQPTGLDIQVKKSIHEDTGLECTSQSKPFFSAFKNNDNTVAKSHFNTSKQVSSLNTIYGRCTSKNPESSVICSPLASAFGQIDVQNMLPFSPNCDISNTSGKIDSDRQLTLCKVQTRTPKSRLQLFPESLEMDKWTVEQEKFGNQVLEGDSSNGRSQGPNSPTGQREMVTETESLENVDFNLLSPVEQNTELMGLNVSSLSKSDGSKLTTSDETLRKIGPDIVDIFDDEEEETNGVSTSDGKMLGVSHERNEQVLNRFSGNNVDSQILTASAPSVSYGQVDELGYSQMQHQSPNVSQFGSYRIDQSDEGLHYGHGSQSQNLYNTDSSNQSYSSFHHDTTNSNQLGKTLQMKSTGSRTMKRGGLSTLRRAFNKTARSSGVVKKSPGKSSGRIGMKVDSRLGQFSYEKPTVKIEAGSFVSPDSSINKSATGLAADSLFTCRPLTSSMESETQFGMSSAFVSSPVKTEIEFENVGNDIVKCLACHKIVRGNYFHVHKRSHLGQKPYQCHICLRTFGQKSNLNKHIKLHTPDKNFSCSGCGKSYVHSYYLRDHQKSCEEFHKADPSQSKFNMETKIYQCSFCKRKFALVESLQKHMKAHQNAND